MSLRLETLSLGQRFTSEARPLLETDFEREFGPPAGHPGPMEVASHTMRLLVESTFSPDGGIMGAGVEALHWPARAQYGDALHVQSEVIELRRSRSRADKGLVRVKTLTLNGAGEVVQSMISTVVVPASS